MRLNDISASVRQFELEYCEHTRVHDENMQDLLRQNRNLEAKYNLAQSRYDELRQRMYGSPQSPNFLNFVSLGSGTQGIEAASCSEPDFGRKSVSSQQDFLAISSTAGGYASMNAKI